MKQVIVTFNFDPETDLVSDVKCTVDGIEKKKKTTTRKKDVVVELEDEALITLETNKLCFNNKAMSILNPDASDRLVIKWIQEGNVMLPIIGTDLAFGEEGSGNKLTKSNTMAYKGKANTVLAELDKEFTLGDYKEGIYKLVPKTERTSAGKTIELKNIIKQAEETEPVLLVDTDEVTEIDPLTFTL